MRVGIFARNKKEITETDDKAEGTVVTAINETGAESADPVVDAVENLVEDVVVTSAEGMAMSEDGDDDMAIDTSVSADEDADDGSGEGEGEGADESEGAGEGEDADDGEDADIGESEDADIDESEGAGESEDADEGEDADIDEGEGTGNSVSKVRIPLKNPAYNGLLPISLLAGLIGFLLGPIPAVLFTLLSDSSNIMVSGDITSNIFYPLFVAAPLIIYLFNSLLKGGRDIRAIIVTAVFSLFSAYLTVLLCIVVTLYTAGVNLTVMQVLMEVTASIGRLDYLPISEFASAYAYPLIFTALGVVIAALLLRGKPSQRTEKDKTCEDTESNETEEPEESVEPEETAETEDTAETEESVHETAESDETAEPDETEEPEKIEEPEDAAETGDAAEPDETDEPEETQ